MLAGPFCCYQLAQLGADAELNKDLMGASFLAQNAGKRSLTINLKNAAGKEVFHRLVATADVVVENFRPGVMDRLGLDYEALKKFKPDLIYCAISGFGQTGPLKDNPAYDQIVQGLSGVMSITGDKNSAPLRVGYPIADTIGGITAAFAVAAALFRRQRNNQGDFIDVSMLEATVVSMGWAVSNWLIAGVMPQAIGNENMTASPSGTFKTGDGLLNIAANQQEQFVKLCDLLGRKELAHDPRYVNREDRKRRRFELNREIELALAARSAGEWAAEFNKNGVPAGEVLSIPEALDHPQIRERGLVKRFILRQAGDREIATLRAGFRLASGDPEPTTPPPQLGADTEKILAELGYDQGAISKLKQDGSV